MVQPIALVSRWNSSQRRIPKASFDWYREVIAASALPTTGAVAMQVQS
jgi:beta-glucosidase/6-phospho-beta-glucosidase/beta-galactosidase